MRGAVTFFLDLFAFAPILVAVVGRMNPNGSKASILFDPAWLFSIIAFSLNGLSEVASLYLDNVSSSPEDLTRRRLEPPRATEWTGICTLVTLVLLSLYLLGLISTQVPTGNLGVAVKVVAVLGIVISGGTTISFQTSARRVRRKL